MNALQSLLVICMFIAAHLVLMYVVAAFMQDAATQEQNNATVVHELRYQGVHYLSKNDKAVECYRHTETNAVYYKQGVQFRCAKSGRIVSTNAALNGWF